MTFFKVLKSHPKIIVKKKLRKKLLRYEDFGNQPAGGLYQGVFKNRARRLGGQRRKAYVKYVGVVPTLATKLYE